MLPMMNNLDQIDWFMARYKAYPLRERVKGLERVLESLRQLRGTKNITEGQYEARKKNVTMKLQVERALLAQRR